MLLKGIVDMDKTYKVLHLASFTGNIGDEANHNGFRRKLQENLNIKIDYTDLEIRNFYKSWSKMKFDQDFIDLCNQNDFVVIGGGNFFELCWDYSKTGTTIDIGVDMLKKIEVPILFNGLGVDDGKGTNSQNIEKFRKFLMFLLEEDKYLLSVRNDGSMKILEKYFSDTNLDKIFLIPDCGFFIQSGNFKHVEIDGDKINIGINLAGDMPNVRFGEKYSEFCIRFGDYLNYILDSNEMINIVFLPHMYRDTEIISKVISNIKDEFRRSRISIAPLLNASLNGCNYIFSLYKQLDLILGMRFHSNVCAIGQNIPSIGLITYHKHGYLFDEIKLSDRALDVSDDCFFDNLRIKTIQDLNKLEEIEKRYQKINLGLNEDIDNFHYEVGKWLKRNKVI
jgi:polysaccharide pyruvyl transferase WcaK-like protein